MSCQREAQVRAFYDGELPAELHAAVEEHVRSCTDCSALLAELRLLSSSIQAAPRASMGADAMRRLEQAWRRQRDRGVLRLAEWLTAAAAAVIIATLTLFPTTRSGKSDQPLAWQTDAMTPPRETDEPASDVVAVAEWMANDLSPDPR